MVVHDVVYHRPLGARCIVHRVHDTTFVVHVAIWVVHNAVHHRAAGARYLWSTILYGWCAMPCTIVHRVHDASFVVHDVVHNVVHRVHDAICVLHDVVHHFAPGARCYLCDALCRATIVHRVRDTTFVVHGAISVVHDVVHPVHPVYDAILVMQDVTMRPLGVHHAPIGHTLGTSRRLMGS